ncbi:Surface antigen-like protein [Leptomonas pyrrhocoris]|uniref:Surface antigen-like protein n=1 Tax=Leptomonas pyrrhocoris TaxID=157538 RepID=A0A0N0DS60_LEPPY|nr:Surface antigen-like protein [Leptomonas pyrrhocoris]XP_015653888.1 Surface antigen-like protein [Leptomonas pyrrhocoris]XP_015653889.1 Surface antigen-like protein [Leptomonas pyrrhocoris]XP_015653890.1 Surface antigen-like protein [Leptomonas pyrrhocoris]KPA75448.1 Surface antigen-like protein [Leptomonas pyrrhocoris]KPA75449.1 Surface antigen-like protein [Leptomonas pyrrhocoris]KPA75450.1 Surface antigen-like protein [Leptomonas pyrrhocoris]KPA75451.1 Surface antigen-like protein [Lep|eukprot:XP_015653887.1 Surface antigen-like protein [Leptomonas pyrrhocoris]
MSVLCRCVAVAVLWWTLVLALPAQAWSITDFPQIDCADTDLEHCSQCHYATIGGVTHFLCAICVDTATTRYSQATQGQNFATCQVYNGNCEMHDCDKCGSDDPKICVACNHGVPDQETSECLGETVSSATGGLYTSSKAPTPVPVPVTTTTTTTPVPVPVTTTTTTTPAPVPVTTTTTTTPVPVPVTTTTTTTPVPVPVTTTTTTTSVPVPVTTTTTTTPVPVPVTTTTTTTTTARPSTPCAIDKCAVCTSDGKACATCVIGYTVTETGTCMQSGYCAVANCVQCAATSYSRCTTCAAGYASNADGVCKRRANGSMSGPTALLVGIAVLAVAVADLL